ncbi:MULTISPECIES: XisI protein [unclassified Microcoleus]|uniref:XisI protein n=1 Tax=unclassified Microcoleus TaxID=2642155 RepID=UPI002FD26548
MDRLEHYRQCIQKLLIEDSKIAPINGEIEVETIFDKEKDRYLAVDLGWDGHRRVYNCVFHLDIKNGKIWIQRNQTDRQIAEELVEMGVPKEDIVLGLQPTYAREHTGFGVA